MENELVWQKICKNEVERKSKIVNMKNKDEKNEDKFFLDRSEEKRIYSYLNYIRNEDKPKHFVPQPSKERRKTYAFVSLLSKERKKRIYSLLNCRRNED
jgi:hypothetical protein